MSADSTKKTILVALGVCLVCSILVSTAAVSLNGIQEQNKKLDKLKNILVAGDLYKADTDIEQTFKEKIKTTIVDLKTGEIVPEEKYDAVIEPEKFDIKSISKNPDYSSLLDAKADLGKIKTKPNYMTVYQVLENDTVKKYILPIYGKGLWATMYGFMALSKDLKTIKGFTYYEHGETPGLGGEVDNPNWKKQWADKIAFDDNWDIKIAVLKGKVDPSNPNANAQIDGLSGATITTRAIDDMIKFWLGENGYGPFFATVKQEVTNE